jgi:exodeoxyribonuclease VII small subunit
MIMDETQDQPEFEELLRQFDEAVSSLESDSLSLEAALGKYESAVSLADKCARILRSAELRISEIDRTLEELDRASDA